MSGIEYIPIIRVFPSGIKARDVLPVYVPAAMTLDLETKCLLTRAYFPNSKVYESFTFPGVVLIDMFSQQKILPPRQKDRSESFP